MTMSTVDVPTFSSTEICRRSGLSYRILDYWVRTGSITPSVCDARGSGMRRLFSAHDLAVLMALGRVWRDMHALDLFMDTRLVQKLWDELQRNGSALIALDTVMIGVTCDGIA